MAGIGTVADFDVDTREMDSALRDVVRLSTRTDHEIVSLNARDLLKSLVFNTPYQSGTGRAGWWPAWRALDLPGTPGTSRREGPQSSKRDRHKVAAGTVADKRDDPSEPSIEFANVTFLYFKHGARWFYLAASHQRGPNAGWFQAAINEATMKFGRAYDRLLRKYSAL